MKKTKTNPTETPGDSTMSELLLLPDGRILAHNVSPAMAALLAKIDPDNADMRARAQLSTQENPNEIQAGN